MSDSKIWYNPQPEVSTVWMSHLYLTGLYIVLIFSMSRRAALALHGHKVNVECVCACYCQINTHTVSALCSCRLVVLMWLRILTTVMECTSETGRLMPTTSQSRLAAHSGHVSSISFCHLLHFCLVHTCLAWPIMQLARPDL